MNYHKFVEWFFDVGEKVLAYVINIFYLTILALPLILVDSVIKESIDSIPLLFIPLTALYAMGLKSLTYAFYMIYFKNRIYYEPFFIRSLIDGFFKKYIYYLFSIALLYFGLTSTSILMTNISGWFLILFFMIILFVLSHLIFTTIQFALYEKNSMRNIINNSIILSFSYGVLTLGLVIILAGIIYYYPINAFLVVTIGLPAYSILLILVQKIIEKRN